VRCQQYHLDKNSSKATADARHYSPIIFPLYVSALMK
jgi:hypothetical protein